MLKGFKEFISRGNVVELAVGVIIGAAFKNIVDALVDGIINPLIAAVIGKHWHPTDDTARDDVMLLVADLLRAHAETGIEMQTWRAALDVVLDHLAAEPEGGDLLHRLGRPAWFTVIGTTKDGQCEPVAVLPGRRRLEVAIGAWTTQVQAPTAADAVRAASRVDRPAA